MTIKRFDKRYLPMLWIGLALWLGSMLVSIILDSMGGTVNGQDALMGYAKGMFSSMPYFTLLLLCVLQPFLEEVAFRLWGVGKKWMTIVCLVFMAFFCVNGLVFWSLAIVGAVLAVWLLVKDRFKQRWINAFLTSIAFTVGHASGFGEFSAGMVLGLVDIFGMALVLNWITINLNFWLSVLVHVLNNTLAILVPLLFVGDPVVYKTDDFTMELTPLSAFSDINKLEMEATDIYTMDSSYSEFYLVGEPAQLASRLASYAPEKMDREFDWESENLTIQERMKLTVKFNKNVDPDFGVLYNHFKKMVEGPMEKTFSEKTDSVMLKEIWLIYPDGREEQLNFESEDMGTAWHRVEGSMLGMRGNDIISDYWVAEDSSVMTTLYCYERPNVILDQMKSMDKYLDEVYGYRIELRDGKKVAMTTIKISDK